ncbi:MAG: asparaginase [Desulfobacula sp.]|nr:asparaginase [Desulfobacula sp.]
MKITIITTGGTIDKIYFDRKSDYEVGDSLVAALLEEANVTADYKVLSILKKDSLDLTDEDRTLIRDTIQKDNASHFVITHGTDTMRSTADMLKGFPGKVIVLTGAMQPARSRSTDAIFNIGSALTAVQLLKPGVYIAMNGHLFDSDRCRKNREQNCFEEIKH